MTPINPTETIPILTILSPFGEMFADSVLGDVAIGDMKSPPK